MVFFIFRRRFNNNLLAIKLIKEKEKKTIKLDYYRFAFHVHMQWNTKNDDNKYNIVINNGLTSCLMCKNSFSYKVIVGFYNVVVWIERE